MWSITATVAARVATALASLVLVVASTVVLSRAVPGTFTSDLALDPSLAPETIAAADARSHAGIATTWLAGLWRGDLGRSLASGQPVVELVADRAVNTLLLTVPATALAWLVVLGYVGWRARRTTAGGAALNTLLAVSQGLPDVVVGLGLLRFALATGWFPVGGAGGSAGSSLAVLTFDRAHHAALPVVGLALVLTPALIRSVEAVLGQTDGDVVLQAGRARGLGEGALRWRHQVRRALPQLAAIVGLSAATLLGSSLVVETVFAWPGLGVLLVEAASARDVPVVLGAVAASALLLVVANAAADAVAYCADPRRR